MMNLSMKLEIGNFYVKEIVFGRKTYFENGTLYVNESEAVSALNPKGRLTNVRLHIACPGESIRLIPVKEIVEPRVRLDGRSLFPGHTGPIDYAGSGQLHALKGMVVTAIGRYGSCTDGLIDMFGPAALLTHFSSLIHLCFTAENTNGDEENDDPYKKNTDFRYGAHLLAEYLGKTILTGTPDNWDVFDFSNDISPSLPKVGVIFQVMTSWVKRSGFNTLLYGKETAHLVPTLLHPNEVLDGALCSDSLLYPSTKEYTYDYQNAPMIRELYTAHGKTLNFNCIILDVNDTELSLKIRASNRIVMLAKMMQLDGIIYLASANGQSEIDFFTTLAKLEENGIKCVGMCMETPGHDGQTQPKVMLDPRVDAIISTGSDHTILELPKADIVIGDLYSIGRDNYAGAWAYNATYGPSLRDDDSLIIDATLIAGQDGQVGWSNKVCKNY